jgi:hypothetical protein
MGNKMDSFKFVKEWFEGFGYIVLEKPAQQDVSCDMTVCGKKKCLRVEIKTVRFLENGAWQIPAVSSNQKQCDCIAVVFPNHNVLVEKMEDYLKNCSDEGYRSMTWLKL